MNPNIWMNLERISVTPSSNVGRIYQWSQLILCFLFKKLLITISITLPVTSHFKFSISSWISFVKYTFIKLYLFDLDYLICWHIIVHSLLLKSVLLIGNNAPLFISNKLFGTFHFYRASLIAQLVKNLPASRRLWFDSWVGKIHWRRDSLPTLWASCSWASLVAQLVKNLSAMWETWVPSLGWEDHLEGKANHFSILAWRIPWTV